MPPEVELPGPNGKPTSDREAAPAKHLPGLPVLKVCCQLLGREVTGSSQMAFTAARYLGSPMAFACLRMMFHKGRLLLW